MRKNTKGNTPTALPKFVDFPAQFTRQQVYGQEARDAIGVNRRITSALLTRSGRQLVEGFTPFDDKKCKLMDETLQRVTSYRDYAKACVELAEAARARLIVISKFLLGNEDGKA